MNLPGQHINNFVINDVILVDLTVKKIIFQRICVQLHKPA